MTMNLKVLEWFGVATAIAYSLFVASNVGLEPSLRDYREVRRSLSKLCHAG